MAEQPRRIGLALVWHMHQPAYTDSSADVPALPWTRLHALKDYADMIDLLGRFPGVRATINVSPALLEQLREFAEGKARPDPFLEWARRPPSELTPDERRFVVRFFLEFRRDNQARDLPRVRELAALRGEHGSQDVPWSVVQRFDDDQIRDLQVLYHLAWCGNLLQEDPVVRDLKAKGRAFSEEDKRRLLEVQDRFAAGVLGRWKDLASGGQVEFSASPYFHPILPLLCDLEAAHEAVPTLRLPSRPFRHPEDARVQVEAGRAAFREVFGLEAAGGWSPECAISEESLRILGECGYRWTVGDEDVLLDSLGLPAGGADAPSRKRRASRLYAPWRISSGPVVLFRDRELSRLIDGAYATWNPRLAAADFVRRLERISGTEAEFPVVTIAQDGENAWEHYPDNGKPFLEALYGALEDSAAIETLHASEAADRGEARRLPRLTAGSWVEGSLSTWVGHPDKNRAWALLGETRDAVAARRGGPRIDDPAWRAVLAAEGSDWFWWLGEDNPTPFTAEFDACFRTKLQAAWRALGEEPPRELEEPIVRAAEKPFRRPVGPVRAVLDGCVTDYFEWLPAGRVRGSIGVLPPTGRRVRQLLFGSDGTKLYLRLDPAEKHDGRSLGGLVIRVVVPGFPDSTVSVALPAEGVAESRGVTMAVDKVVEIAVPLDRLPEERDGRRFQVLVEGRGGTAQRIPPEGSLLLPSETEQDGLSDWYV